MSAKKMRKRSWLPRRAFLEWAVLSMLLSTLAIFLGTLVGLGRADLVLYDAVQSLRHRPVPEDIVIVAIDDESVTAVGRWPWRRAILATLLDRIAATHPRAIGIDVILSEPDDRDPKGDAALAAVLRSTPGVLLPVATQAGGGPVPQVLLPAQPFLDAGVRLGHVHVEPDMDGAVRSLYLREGYPGKQWPAFSLALGAGALDQGALPGDRRLPEHVQPDSWRRDYRVHIDFAGPPGTIERVPALALLTGAQNGDGLAGKFVLVGATATGLGDAYPTPMTGHAELMPGVEVQAQALNALLRGRTTVFASPTANALFTFIPVAAALTGFVILAPRLVLLLVAGLIAATLAASALLLTYAQVWYPPAAAALILIVAYPLWSWRRLEAVVRFLGNQFEQLEREPAVVPSAPEPPSAGFSDVLGRKISAVRSAADRLRETRRFVADSLDSLPVATLVAGPDEHVLIANRRAGRMFGANNHDELRGQALADMFRQLAPDRLSLWEDARRSLREGNHAEIEFKDAGGRSLLLDGAPSVNSHGEPVGLLVTLVDLSGIREAQRRRDEALAFLSHDIRSPQASILAVVELHDLDPQTYPAATTLAKIEGFAHATIELAEQFVQLSHVETQAYQLAACDLGEIAREAVEAVQALAAAKSIRVEFAGGGALPLYADRGLLLRAIVNLANNAVKYSPPDTTVTVTVSAENNLARCAVRDQGYGISEKDQKRLFERFARFSNTGQPREKGIGLGLAFVKTVIERHEGRMSVTSKPGAGSEFGFVLPMAAAAGTG
ncbi:MAG: CHASE2 domain-containing protein [Burkholderiales bacterium]|nr:CHASE2 domain-containing protein [Burkholderiales bacterium]